MAHACRTKVALAQRDSAATSAALQQSTARRSISIYSACELADLDPCDNRRDCRATSFAVAAFSPACRNGESAVRVELKVVSPYP
eukprot:scaffold240857_cov30-Tisochrysis_lutea.AAC.4